MNLKNTIVLGMVAVLGFTGVVHNINVQTAVKKQEVVRICNEKETRDKVLKKYSNVTTLNEKQLMELLSAVGFKGEGLKMAWAIAMAESNGRPMAFNGNRKTGDSSYGIFQINMIGDLGPDRREKFDLNYNSDLLNPVRNAQIAFHMTNGGTNWSAWKDGQNIRVKEFLTEVPAI